jgi:hypothetical protein
MWRKSEVSKPPENCELRCGWCWIVFHYFCRATKLKNFYHHCLLCFNQTRYEMDVEIVARFHTDVFRGRYQLPSMSFTATATSSSRRAG